MKLERPAGSAGIPMMEGRYYFMKSGLSLSFILLYLDAGTGNLIMQFLIAVVTAAIFSIRGIRERIVIFFH